MRRLALAWSLCFLMLPGGLAAQSGGQWITGQSDGGRKDPAPPSAQTAGSSFTFHGRTIPLPPGDWRQVAEATTVRRMAGGGGLGGRNADVALLRVSSGRVTGLVTISVSIDVADNFAGGWSRESECQRNDIHAVQIYSDVPTDQRCWAINHLVMTRGANASEFINNYYAAAAAAGGMPPTMLRVVARRSDNLHFTTVRYHFVPDASRFPPATQSWRESPWHRDRLDGDRAAYIAALRAWAPTTFAGIVAGAGGGRVPQIAEPH